MTLPKCPGSKYTYMAGKLGVCSYFRTLVHFQSKLLGQRWVVQLVFGLGIADELPQVFLGHGEGRSVFRLHTGVGHVFPGNVERFSFSDCFSHDLTSFRSDEVPAPLHPGTGVESRLEVPVMQGGHDTETLNQALDLEILNQCVLILNCLLHHSHHDLVVHSACDDVLNAEIPN